MNTSRKSEWHGPIHFVRTAHATLADPTDYSLRAFQHLSVKLISRLVRTRLVRTCQVHVKVLLCFAAILAVLSSNPAIAAPNTCQTACTLTTLLGLGQCAESALLCGPAAEACFTTCAVPVVATGVICLYGCSGGGGGYAVKASEDVFRYTLGGTLSLAAGRWVGNGFAVGQGTVTRATFYMMDLSNIPLGGFPPGTAVESLPWIPLGNGVFDNNSSLWRIQVQMGGPAVSPLLASNATTELGKIIRIDFEDSVQNFISTGTGIALLSQVNTSVTVISASPTSITAGQSVTLTATVTGNAPTGTVQFQVNGVNIGSPVALVNGVAVLTTTAISPGANEITAVYSGDTSNAASSSAVGVTVTVLSSNGDVPTLPQWGAIMMVGLLLWTMLSANRRQRSRL